MRARQSLVRVAAAAGSFTLVVSGLFVVLALPAAASVTDEVGFRAAWTSGSTTAIDLGANITLGCNGVSGAGRSARTSATAIVVDGHGFSLTQTCTAAGKDNGVLDQEGTGAVTLQNITITGGSANGEGGAIVASSADVAITNSTISGNAATGSGAEGGAIRESSGNVTVTNSTISGNTASGDGAEGGAIRESSGNVTVTNSTISGNSVSGTAGPEGGAIRESSGTITLVYATVVQNSSPDAQLHFSESPLTSFGSVVALPLGGASNCNGSPTTTSHGFNFSDDASCVFTAGTDKQSAGDPMLGALANTGGATQTQVPQTGSPLIDGVAAGSCQADGATGITTDQRGLPRPDSTSPACDIGAVEVQPATPTPTPTPTPAPAAVVITPTFTG